MAKRPKDTEFEKWIRLGDKFMLSVSIFKNQEKEVVLNLRKFFLTKDEEEWRPDKQGLTMHLSEAKKLRIITKALEEIQDEAPKPSWASKDKKEEKTSKKSKKRKDEDEDDDDD